MTAESEADMDKNEGLSYRAAGVDIDAANESVNMLKKWVDATRRPEVLSHESVECISYIPN